MKKAWSFVGLGVGVIVGAQLLFALIAQWLWLIATAIAAGVAGLIGWFAVRTVRARRRFF